MAGVRYLLAVAALALVHLGSAELGMSLAVDSGNVTPLWLPAGLDLAILYLFGLRLWPGVLIGDLVSLMDTGVPTGVLFGEVAANILAALVGAWLLRRLRHDHVRLREVRDVMAVGVVAPVVAVSSAVPGVGSLWLGGVVASADVAETVETWLLADLAGVLVVSPVLLAWLPLRRLRLRGRLRKLEAIALATVLAGTVTVAFTMSSAGYLVFPAIVWGAMRFGPRGAALASAVVSAGALVAAASGSGPFAGRETTDALLFAQSFTGVATLTGLALAAASWERVAAVRALRASEERNRDFAAEQAALHRVAAAVARGGDPRDVFGLVAEEIGRAIGVQAGAVLRFEATRHAQVMGSWAVDETLRLPPGTAFEIEPNSSLAAVRRNGCAARVGALRDGPLPFEQRASAPVRLGDRLWGALGVASAGGAAMPEDAEAQLERFSELVGLAIANADAREQLLAQATSDPLTGLMNHRAFHEHLTIEVERARRHGRELALALFDVDRFKEVNDVGGHVIGDAVLREIAHRMAGTVRAEEALARVGGDEFALLLPESEGMKAFAAAERLRAAVSNDPIDGAGHIRLSAGVCDLAVAADADELVRLADGALYWAKAHGRDVCFRYTPEVVEELSAEQRAERLQRSQAISGLRALAAAIDAKDPLTKSHSERVADMAVRLAEARDWPTERLTLLREAALVHDVGKIGVPDAILFKPGRLEPDEYEQIKRHAALGAQIASEVLTPEQVTWIRAHHERPDGRGYPDGLRGHAISEGAQLLALADAWDAMTGARSYSSPMTEEAALEECRALAGRQFSQLAVAALEAVAAGAPAMARIV